MLFKRRGKYFLTAGLSVMMYFLNVGRNSFKQPDHCFGQRTFIHRACDQTQPSKLWTGVQGVREGNAGLNCKRVGFAPICNASESFCCFQRHKNETQPQLPPSCRSIWERSPQRPNENAGPGSKSEIMTHAARLFIRAWSTAATDRFKAAATKGWYVEAEALSKEIERALSSRREGPR